MMKLIEIYVNGLFIFILMILLVLLILTPMLLTAYFQNNWLILIYGIFVPFLLGFSLEKELK